MPAVAESAMLTAPPVANSPAPIAADEPGGRYEGGGPTMAGDNLVLVVTIASGDVFAGTLTSEPGEPGLAFSGWLGFVEAIDVLRRRASERNMGRPPDDGGGLAG